MAWLTLKYFSINCELAGVTRVAQIIVGQNEGIESALRRFKKEVSQAGIFPDLKKHRHFETPIEKRKRKAIARQKERRRFSSRYRKKNTR